jgi:hypothetical protein
MGSPPAGSSARGTRPVRIIVELTRFNNTAAMRNTVTGLLRGSMAGPAASSSTCAAIPGSLLDQSVVLAEMFMDHGQIVSTAVATRTATRASAPRAATRTVAPSPSTLSSNAVSSGSRH